MNQRDYDMADRQTIDKLVQMCDKPHPNPYEQARRIKNLFNQPKGETMTAMRIKFANESDLDKCDLTRIGVILSVAAETRSSERPYNVRLDPEIEGWEDNPKLCAESIRSGMQACGITVDIYANRDAISFGDDEELAVTFPSDED